MKKIVSCLLAIFLLASPLMTTSIGVSAFAAETQAAENETLPDADRSDEIEAVPVEEDEKSPDAEEPTVRIADSKDASDNEPDDSSDILSVLPDARYLDSFNDSIDNMRAYYENKYQDSFEGSLAEIRAYYSDSYSNEYEKLLEKYSELKKRYPELLKDTQSDAVVADDDTEIYDDDLAATGASDLTYDLTNGVLTVYASGDWYSGKQPPWRDRRDEIREVVIKPGTTKINQYAFYMDKNLKKVTIPSSVTSIEYAAFYQCVSLDDISLPSKLSTIGDYAFDECTSLNVLTIPGSVVTIGKVAFAYSALKSVAIPNSVASLGDYSFYKCSALVSASIGTGVKEIGNQAFRGCTSLKTVTGLSGLTTLGKSAFYDCAALNSISFSNKLTSIGEFAFSGCSSLTSITIPDSVKEMGAFTFQSCEKLETAILPLNMEVLPRSTFANCINLNYVRFPGNLSVISYSAFQNASALKVNIPPTVKVIEARAFENTSSDGTLTIPDSVERIEKYAFSKIDNLQKVIIGSGLSVIGDNPFRENDDLSEISISSANFYFTSIDGAMYDKNMMLIAYPPARSAATVNIPDGVKEIGSYAFSHAYNIKNMTLPDSVISIGDHAFISTSYLVYKNGVRSVVSKNTFESFKFSKNLKEIGSRAFYECGFVSLDLPESLNRLGEKAFGGAFLPESVFIPKNVDSIGEAPFWLARVSNFNVDSSNPYYKSVNGSILSKDGKVFVEMPNPKTSCNIPQGVEKIADEAFDSTDLKSVTFPYTLRVIGSSAFGNTDLAGEITLPDNVTKIHNSAFSLNYDLTGVTLGKSLSYLGAYAFYHCNSLKSVKFKGGAPELQKGSIFADDPDYTQFNGDNLTAYYPQKDSTWNEVIGYNFGENITWKPWDSTIVEKINISSCEISLENKPLVYDGKVKQPKVTVRYNNTDCLCGVDYNLEYKNAVNAGDAAVVISGTGRFNGSVEKKFTIGKAEQTVTASLTPNELKVGDSAEIEASGKGTISYTSTASNIAEVSSSGLVTAKSKGTAEIRVKAAGNSNFKPGEEKVTVTVKEVEVKRYGTTELTYDFENYYTDLGYVTYVGKGKGWYSLNSSNGKYEYDPRNGSYIEDEGYKIPLESYYMFFSNAEAKTLYNPNKLWKGSCAGFVGASLIFNNPSASLKVNDFKSTAKHISDLKYTDTSSSMNITLVKFLECVQVGQNADPVLDAKCDNYNDMAGLVEEVKKCDKGALPVYVGVQGSGGHALAAYRYEYVNSSSDRIYLYDCNDAYQEHYLTLYKKGGEYTGFRYEHEHIYTSSITYVPASCFLEMWNNRKKVNNYYNSIMLVKSENFDLMDSDGKKVASMREGVFSSASDDIIEVPQFDIEMDAHELRLPSDTYQVVSYDTTPANELEVSMVNKDQAVSVKTESDTVTLTADDTQALSLAKIDGEEGEYYEVTVDSSMEYSENKEEMVYQGKSDGSEVTVGSSYGEDFSYEYTRSGYFVNSDAYNTGAGETSSILNNCEITLDKTVFNYTGEPVQPQVTVVCNDVTLTQNVDYIVAYTPAGDDGTAEATVYGIGGYTGTASVQFKVNKLDISGSRLDLGASSFPYTGSSVTPEPTLTVNGVALAKGVDYTVSYENNSAPGTGSITLTGVNNCTGSIRATFSITEVEVKSLLGDTDGNGEVDMVDATLVQRAVTKLQVPYSAEQMMRADIDGDGDLTVVDATFIQRYSTNVATPYPIGETIK